MTPDQAPLVPQPSDAATSSYGAGTSAAIVMAIVPAGRQQLVANETGKAEPSVAPLVFARDVVRPAVAFGAELPRAPGRISPNLGGCVAWPSFAPGIRSFRPPQTSSIGASSAPADGCQGAIGGSSVAEREERRLIRALDERSRERLVVEPCEVLL